MRFIICEYYYYFLKYSFYLWFFLRKSQKIKNYPKQSFICNFLLTLFGLILKSNELSIYLERKKLAI